MKHAVRAVLVIGSIIAVACLGLDTVLVTQRMTQLSVDVRNVQGDGVVRISAIIEKPFAKLDRLEARLRTSSGDDESFLLGPSDCGGYVCDEFMVSMRDGHTIEELRSRAPAVGGILRVGGIADESGTIVHRPTWFGVIELELGANPPAWAMERARLWSGVKSVELNGLYYLGPGPLVIAGAHARLHARPATAPPVQGDGVLQWSGGDTLTVEYQQPDGSLLSCSAVLATPRWVTCGI